MFLNWLPLRFLISRAAKRYGFMDPVTFLARLRGFAQPSEVEEPIELIRAGIVFHARGLINTRTIQYNLDWVWPFWVEKQFEPGDDSFIPRGFSFSHINSTHRNWTAVGRPDMDIYPIIDPKGLVTPFFDSWSIDFWFMDEAGNALLPSKSKTAEQKLETESNLLVETRVQNDAAVVETRVCVEMEEGIPVLKIRAGIFAREKGYFAVSLRPYNTEGIQFIESLSYEDSSGQFLVNKQTRVKLDQPADAVFISDYQEGDVFYDVKKKAFLKEKDAFGNRDTDRTCKMGMASGSAMYLVEKDAEKTIRIKIPLDSREEPANTGIQTGKKKRTEDWNTQCATCARLDIPDEKMKFLYDAAVRTLILLSADEVVPGPFTYRRFWFRDACFMIHGLLCANLWKRAGRILDTFPGKMKNNGYFRSQNGEWDSNGQVLWIMEKYLCLTGKNPDETWLSAMEKGAQWIVKKRIREKGETLHNGLLPPGFSAEHFGPNDYYFWDDFWGVAGLYSAAKVFRAKGYAEKAEEFRSAAEDFSACIWEVISRIPVGRSKRAIPASPYRRMDAGAIGSMVCDYPLQLVPQDSPAVARTMEYLLSNCFFDGAFFQDMIHSGLNIYLTLAIAQSLFRRKDERYKDLVIKVADLASPTGQWPEAIHPRTLGGCMGDGQHGWAAAEWVAMIRNLFVREEEGRVILGQGIFPEWLQEGRTIHFGPTLTQHGYVDMNITRTGEKLKLILDTGIREDAPCEVTAEIPGYETTRIADPAQGEISISALS